MNDEDVRRVLTFAVEDVRASGLDASSWSRAQKQRRRRRVTIASGVLTVGVASTAAFVVADAPRRDDAILNVAQTPNPLPSASSAKILAQTAPGPRANARLPQTASPYAPLSAVPKAAPPLSSSAAATAALAVLQVAPDELLILTQGGQWRSQRLDSNTLGNQVQVAAGGARISPDGLRIAIPAGENVVVVDVQSGSLSVQKPSGQGRELQYLNWLDNRRLVAGGDFGQSEWVIPGVVKPSEISAGDIVRGAPEATQLLARELVLGAAPSEARLRLPSSSAVHVDAWYGDAVARGSQIARTAFINANDEQAVLVVDARTGGVTGALRLSYEARSQGCCAVLGWMDESRVLFRDGDVVLAWRVGTTQLERIATLPQGASVTLALSAGPRRDRES